MTQTGRKNVVFALALAGVAAMSVADYMTDPEFAFSLLYLIPIVECARHTGLARSMIVAVLATACWFYSFAFSSEHATYIIVWNSFTRFMIFCGTAWAVSQISRQRAQLKKALDDEVNLARTDALTGLPNRRAFLDRVRIQHARSSRVHEQICLVYIDLDNFKAINDKHGHAAGDEALVGAAAVLNASIRATDFAARLGGDEFALLLWRCDEPGAREVAQRIHAGIGALARKFEGCGLGASVGIAIFDVLPETPEKLIELADGAMYEAKQAGKGRANLWLASDKLKGDILASTPSGFAIKK